MNKFLIIVRTGDNSLHRKWIADPDRDFDVFVSYYGKVENCYKEDAEYWECRPGPKWGCIADLLADNPELISQYRGFWFPDDDLDVETATINRMFALFHGLQLSLAQPALTHDSFISWPLVLRRPDCVMRRVNFVEVMAPLFDRKSLIVCLPTFGESRSGWGLDFVWSGILGGSSDAFIGIIDATPVRHTRPVGSGGDLYKNHPEMNPVHDCERLLAKYGVDREYRGAPLQVNALLVERALPVPERFYMWLKKINRSRLITRKRKLRVVGGRKG